jgi:hypothetical protein
MRYRFYREHKYVSYAVSELERLIAKTDFRNKAQVDIIKNELANIEALMTGHAEWEESSIHELLRKKQSSVHTSIEIEHKEHAAQFKELQTMIASISDCQNETEQFNKGYAFYIAYRHYAANNLKHLHEEETIIMPELQKLYSDEELRAVEFKTYAQMTPEQMIQMMEVLFPHMNPNDREFFLTDIHDAEPDKFMKAWEGIKDKIESCERELLIKKFLLLSAMH